MAHHAPSRADAVRRAGHFLPSWVPRPGAERGSLLYGAAVAAACAALYHALRAASGYELSVLAVAVGDAVGRAVRRGADPAPVTRRGRALAVTLTFLAIAGAQLGGAVTSELELLAHSVRGATRSSLARVSAAGAGADPCEAVPAEIDVAELLWAEIEGSAGDGSTSHTARSALARLCAVRRAREQGAAPPPFATSRVASSVAALRYRAASLIVGEPADEEARWLRATLARPLEEVLFGTPLAALAAAVLLGSALRRAWGAAAA